MCMELLLSNIKSATVGNWLEQQLTSKFKENKQISDELLLVNTTLATLKYVLLVWNKVAQGGCDMLQDSR